uniref:anthocyanidin 3-O-glucosyltransferase n=1 Tax=Linum usitatissimum TaxID=4006 RepID=I2BH29_LINUS|nr:UDP-glycosyltransferase 1 [Linum usitatissimum]
METSTVDVNHHPQPPHIVLLASPGTGHLIPVLELGIRLVTHHNATVTVFVVATDHSSPAEAHLILDATARAHYSSKNNTFNVVKLPPPDISNLTGPETAVVTHICMLMRETRPTLRSAMRSLEVPPAALVVDLFGTESFAIADEMEIGKYLLVTSNAWFTALALHTPALDREVDGQYVDQTEPLTIPGCRSIRPDEVVDPMLDRNDMQYVEYKRTGAEFAKADGILINTWEDLEPSTLAALRNDKFFGRSIIKGDVLSIGPLVRPSNNQRGPTEDDELFSWLDKQPKQSVIYVSFGSVGTLSTHQLNELAYGLELSKQRFVWVVRRPTDSNDSAGGSGEIPGRLNYLPGGFLERTRYVGMVVPNWAPQAEVLSHPSVGWFLSHCGWNSTLESVTNGVPMVAWPMYAEQRMNSTLLAEELKVAARTKTLPWRGVVGRDEIAELVKKVMVGEEGVLIREKVNEVKWSGEKVNEVKCSGEKALKEGSGSSFRALASVVDKCTCRYATKF